MNRFFSYAGMLSVGLLLSLGSASADAALHGFCAGAGQCIDNGTNSPTSINPPSDFGFTEGSQSTTGDLLLEILVPDNRDPAPSLLSFGVTGSATGTATLFKTTEWNSGTLANYIFGFKVTPNNPIGNYVPDPADSGAGGFFVYQFNAGTQTLNGPGSPVEPPDFNLTSKVPVGTYILGFLNSGTPSAPDWVATANSGAILETPEPSSLLWLLPAFGAIAWKKRRA